MIDLVGIRDGCFDADAVLLAFVKLAGKCCDVWVRGVAPWGSEVGFGLNFSFVCDDGPSLDVVEE